MDPKFLGIDLGTTSVKVVLISADGILLKSVSYPTSADVPSSIGCKGCEQNVVEIIKALQKCMAEIIDDGKPCVSKVGISGQMHGVMMWKSSHMKKYREGLSIKTGGDTTASFFESTSNLITWQDQRCDPDFLQSLPSPDSHLTLATGQGCPTLIWLKKNQPDLLLQYDCAGTVMDFLVAILCQRSRPLMTFQIAASWGYFNCQKGQWNQRQLEEADFPMALLPEVVSSGEPAGSLQSDWLGVSDGTILLAALGDMQCAVCSSLKQSNHAVLNMSTSCQLSFPMMHPDFKLPVTPDPESSVQYFPYFDGIYIAVAASLNCGNVLAGYVSMIQKWMANLGVNIDETKIWQNFLTQSADIKGEVDLPVIHPTLYGERHCPSQRGYMENITTDNLELGAIFRALCKGIVRNIHEMMSSSFLKENGVSTLACTGTVIARNELVKREIDLLYGGIEREYGHSCDSAYGAALVAAKGIPKFQMV
ncbi:hypothetical protein FSP39_017963 [Pinctada imbricata]|uniref:Sedoheptulokinase n=1 Tax=Pinctada imbricata TaxID=66713 RepID=A0AA88XFV0_PINIB|nr:hypothetical protein FSP39_017963 [Pinctada imbricata]